MIYKPSELSPNFEEIPLQHTLSDSVSFWNIQDGKITFEFQVHTNGSYIRSYMIELLTSYNDQDSITDNVIGVKYGLFDSPLSNLDTAKLEINVGEFKTPDALTPTIDLNYIRDPMTDLRWRIRLYEDEININESQINYESVYGKTKCGTGYVVGTTRNVIWTTQYDSRMKPDTYIGTRLLSSDRNNDFYPVIQEKTYEGKYGLIKVHGCSQTGDDNYYVIIDLEDIRKSYRDKLCDGNMYITRSNNISRVNADASILKISGVQNAGLNEHPSWVKLMIDKNQGNPSLLFEGLNEPDFVRFLYIQREKIVSVDSNVGTHSLTKIQTSNPFHYNLRDEESCVFNLPSNKYQRNKIYIEPIDEFSTADVGTAYIHIRTYSRGSSLDDAITVDGELKTDKETLDSTTNAFDQKTALKITEYVGTTGEITLFSNLDFDPDIKYKYEIFIIDKSEESIASDNPKYIRIFPKNARQPRIIGGGSCIGDIDENSLAITKIKSNSTTELFIQPNILIKPDMYKSCNLQIQDTYYPKSENKIMYNDVYVQPYTTSYNKNIVIDQLDGSQWLIQYKNISAAKSEYIYPQSQYIIWSNFVDSTPESYVHLRPNKEVILKAKNVYSNTDPEPLGTGLLTYRDVQIESDIYDVDYDPEQTGAVKQNRVPIKYYKYTVTEKLNDNVVKVIDFGEKYDNRMAVKYYGLQPSSNTEKHSYDVLFIAIDELGQQYEKACTITTNYTAIVKNDGMLTITQDVCEQYNHLNCTPIRRVPFLKAETGEYENNNVMVKDKNGEFYELYEGAGQNIVLGSDNNFVFRFGPSQQMIEQPGDYTLMNFETDVSSQQDKRSYKVTLDTRPYFEYIDPDNKLRINHDYMILKVFIDDDAKIEWDLSTSTSGVDLGIKKPVALKYLIQPSSHQPDDDKYIYFTMDSPSQVEDDERYPFAPDACINRDKDKYVYITDSDYIVYAGQGYTPDEYNIAKNNQKFDNVILELKKYGSSQNKKIKLSYGTNIKEEFTTIGEYPPVEGTGA